MCMKRERDGEICENGTVKVCFPIMKHFLFPFYSIFVLICLHAVNVNRRKAGNVDDDDDDVSFCKKN